MVIVVYDCRYIVAQTVKSPRFVAYTLYVGSNLKSRGAIQDLPLYV